MALIGLYPSNKDNVYEWPEMSADGSTTAVEVNGTSFTFVDVVGGTNPNVTISHQGSLDGTNWFELEEHSYNSHGVQAKFYSDKPMRFVRTTVSSLGGDETVTSSVMVN